MDSEEVRRIRKALGVTQSEFASLVGVHLVTVKKWETGAQGMRAPADRLIRLLAEKAAKGLKRNPAPRRRRTSKKRER